MGTGASASEGAGMGMGMGRGRHMTRPAWLGRLPQGLIINGTATTTNGTAGSDGPTGAGRGSLRPLRVVLGSELHGALFSGTS